MFTVLLNFKMNTLWTLPLWASFQSYQWLPFVDMAHSVTESPFFVFGVFTVFVFGIYFSNFFESSILRIWCV